MPITLRYAWTAPTGITFPEGTVFVESATSGTWDWKTPHGCWGQSNLMGWRPGETY